MGDNKQLSSSRAVDVAKNNIMNHKIKFSIITVCFNSEEFIRTAIESVLSQDYVNIEYIVIDGNSTDATVSIVKEYTDKIVHLVSEPDMGIYDAMNKGIALASGDVIGILNSDDFYPHTHVLSDVAHCFETKQEIDIVLGNVDYVHMMELNVAVRYYSSSRFVPWKLRFGLMPAHPGAFIKKSAYMNVGQYKLGYKIAADFDMFVRIFMHDKATYITLNEVVVRMRVGGVSTSGIDSYIVSSKEMIRSLKENTIYTCWLFILVRLPIKMSLSLSFRLSNYYLSLLGKYKKH